MRSNWRAEGRSYARTLTSKVLPAYAKSQPCVQTPPSDPAGLRGPCPPGSSTGTWPLLPTPGMQVKPTGAERKRPLRVQLLFGAGDTTSSRAHCLWGAPSVSLGRGGRDPQPCSWYPTTWAEKLFQSLCVWN